MSNKNRFTRAAHDPLIIFDHIKISNYKGNVKNDVTSGLRLTRRVYELY